MTKATIVTPRQPELISDGFFPDVKKFKNSTRILGRAVYTSTSSMLMDKEAANGDR
jgi:hypothetical protein